MFVQCFDLFVGSMLPSDGQTDNGKFLTLLQQEIMFQPIAPCNAPEIHRQL